MELLSHDPWLFVMRPLARTELDWRTPAKRYDGTPFTDRGFCSVPAVANVADLLDAIFAA